MKNYHNYLLVCLLILSSVSLYSCMGIEDCCEDPVIVQDTVKLPPVVIEDTTTTIRTPKDYMVTIQIGAFRDRTNAEKWRDEARSKLSAEVNVEFDSLDGLYKVVMGRYENVQTANALLPSVISRGYTDAFVREIK